MTHYALLITAVLFLLLTPAASADTRTYQRSVEKYAVPDVTLINQDGNKVRFKNFLSEDKPVVVDFIFGTCTTICPVLSAGYASLQQKLGGGSEKVHLVSISIDPENDKPAVLKDYLKRYRSKPGWDFLTGSRKDIERVMKAFNANIPDKMSHYALTFIRMPKEESWIRINGMMSTSEFLAESQKAGIR
ncbi:MAG: SCO family protein [Nitrospirae bacterium]|nr:SCO family protein [Nitrospirota bacterium]